MPTRRAASDTLRNGVKVASRVSERGVHFVAHDADAVPVREFGDRHEVLTGMHQAERVVRIAQEEHARSLGERALQSRQVERPGAAIVDEGTSSTTPPASGT